MSVYNKILNILKKEAVLFIALFATIVSAFFNPPGAEYIGFIDFKVLCLLFCLMAIICGFTYCNVFNVIAQKLLAGKKSFRILALMLIIMPFFTSMLITNDVALLTFVPFSIMLLKAAKKDSELIPIIILQTIAANLGSMATPIGNPQNLFIYGKYKLLLFDFETVLLPYVIISFFVLIFFTLFIKSQSINVYFEKKEKINNHPRLFMLIILFVLCLLCILKIVPYQIVTAIVLLYLLLFNRNLFCKIDYSLLLTFVCFFIFSGNIAQIEPVRNVLRSIMLATPITATILTSQVISNVPAAVLLSEFTSNWQQLLIGVNIGSLGTPVASLASLISFKLYLKSENHNSKKYLLCFLIINIIFLLVLIVTVLLVNLIKP